jgi:hypothetical protein
MARRTRNVQRGVPEKTRERKRLERHYLDKANSVQVCYRVEWDVKGNVTSYALAYIDPTIFAGDHGRVLGYDNRHGYHHRHYFGSVAAYDFTGYGATEARFEAEFWEIYHEHHGKG